MLLKRGRKIQFLVKFYNTNFCINFSTKTKRLESLKEDEFIKKIHYNLILT